MASAQPTKKSSRRKDANRRSVRMLPRARVAAAVKTLSAPSGTARFAPGKALCVTAEKDPCRVYPYFDAIAALLASDSKIVRWVALRVVALMAPADTLRKLDAHLDAYLEFVRGNDLISAANAIQGAGVIARSRPDLRDRIVRAILDVEQATYATPECRNVAIGQTLDVLDDLGPDCWRRPDVALFVRRQTSNTRNAVARRAKGMFEALSAVAK